MSNVGAIKKDISRRMEGAIEVLHSEFAGLRSGRAATSLLEPVQVDAYGSKMPFEPGGDCRCAGTAFADGAGLG